MRKAVSAAQRLTLTLRYLATETCRAIYNIMKTEYLKLPSTPEEWNEIALHYFQQWNFPNCIGALDGKRVLNAKPPHSGAGFHDYKGHFSMIMMALVDASYKFLYVNIGANGRASDGGVWDRCSLKEAIDSEVLNIPSSCCLPFTDKQSPYVIVGDEAFPIKPYLMKPFPGRELNKVKTIFNYRLSRARRTSENAFGIIQ
ncbi:uncharacterized protein [Macrobrachium rosenbergii]|uniref:uncharacterized protein n=1 Tax=Macrobrachium rosenbergii TaxID=79674 RepID=UPI0034D45676